MKNASARTAIKRSDYSPPAFLIENVSLDVEIDTESTTVKARLSLARNEGVAADTPLQLDGEGLQTSHVSLDSVRLAEDAYQIDGNTLTIQRVPERFELDTEVVLRPDENTALEGFYRSGDFLLTQCEAEGFRRITWFIDRPDVMSRYKVRMSADRDQFPVLLSNGNPGETGVCSDNPQRHYAEWDDPFPKPSYLFAMVAGKLEYIEDQFVTMDGRTVTLKLWAEAANMHNVDYAMEALKRSMKWDEERFGLAYDLNIFQIVATDDFNMGAMENKSLNIFNSKYVLASPETATDADYEGIEGVIGHEYFHNWTGNRVTCRDWFQLTLKEGLTVFRDQEFSADMQSRATQRIGDVRALRVAQFPEDAGPMAHPVRPDAYVEINNFYTATVYQKGAEVIRMYHSLLGGAGFRRGMDLYFERHDGQAVTCDDFFAAMRDANNDALEGFSGWYEQAGTPIVKVESDYVAQDQTLTLTLTQHTPDTPGQEGKKPVLMPVRLGLIGEDGNDLPLHCDALVHGDTLRFCEARQVFSFTDVPSEPVVSVFRGFSAPVNVEQALSSDQLKLLLRADSDPFNRWQASQTLASNEIKRLVAEPGNEVDAQLVDILVGLVGEKGADPALIAEMLRVPDETTMASAFTPFDPDAIHQARLALVSRIGQVGEKALQERYRSLTSTDPYQPDAEQIARRTLRNVCLDLLRDRPVGQALAQAQFDTADNMTDRFAALRSLVFSRSPQAADVLQRFLEQFEDDALVMDKWLAVQAMVPGISTLQSVRQLMQGSVFNILNPNKVRSLIGAFLHGNPTAFHDLSGDGYKFAAECVLTLDRTNPQIAARLVSAFNTVARIEKRRAVLMTAVLQGLASHDLSSDVGEIVDRALAQAG